MASTMQYSILWGADVSGKDERKANKLLRNNDFELGFLFPGALHIAQGLIVTGQFMMYFKFNFWLSNMATILPKDSFSSSVI